MRVGEKAFVPRHASDVYSSVTLQTQPPTANMFRLNKKSFDCFTQKNIRRNLISANHIKQMKLCKDLQHIVTSEGEKEVMQPLARSVGRHNGLGSFSKPGGKLAKSRTLTSSTPSSHPAREMPAAEQCRRVVSLEESADVLGPVSPSADCASQNSTGLKGQTDAVLQSVVGTRASAESTSLDCYSFTQSDLSSNNSFLRSSFPSLASSTQSAQTFISAGAGPHCPSAYPQEMMDSDSSLVQRGNRFRLSRTKVTGLCVLGVDYGDEPLAALRMVFKTYEPAVTLSKKSLKDPSYEDISEDLEKFALSLMEDGEVKDSEDLCMLSEVLVHVKQVLAKVLARPQQVKRLLPAQKIVEFAPDGPVMNRLDVVIAEVGRLEEEEQQRKDNEIIAADFEADSFQERGGSLRESHQIGGMAVGKELTSPVAGLGMPAVIRERSYEEESQEYEKGEPEKKKPRTSLESVFVDKQALADCEDVLRAELLDKTSLSSAAVSTTASTGSLDSTLVRTGEAALIKFQKIGGAGDLLPSDESDEETWDESITTRNPKGKLKFLLGPMDPRARRRYIHAGPVPFTGDSAKDYRDTMAKAKLAVLSCKAGEEVTDAKQLAALKKMADMGSGHNSYGVQSDGFQLLRAYTDPKNYKTNPCDETKKVAWEASTEFTDSQSRYLPWFLLIAKMHRRYKMPTPEKQIIDPKWSEKETNAYMKAHEASYLEQMKGESRHFIQALEAEVRADEDQTTYALKTFYKCWFKQGEGLKE